MKKNEPIETIMSRDLITVRHGDPVSKARQLLETHGMHHQPVVNGSELAGIISWTDILRITFGDLTSQDSRSLDATLDHTYTLEDVMNKEPRTIGSSATVREAAQALGDGSYHSLPVVEGGTLVGLVTSTDLIRYLADQY